MKPLITIITATFNLIESGRLDSFKKCIQSVQSQDYSNIEHIIIDGASTDGTVDILKEYKNKDLIRYISENDNGIYDAFNKGIQEAHGDYVLFLNSDDYFIDDSFISKSIEAIANHNADFSYSNAIVLKGNIDNLKKEFWPGRIDEYYFGRFPCHQTILMNKELIKELGCFDTEKYGCADNVLILKAIKKGAIGVHINTNAVCFNGNGFSSSIKAVAYKHYLECFCKLFPQISIEDYELMNSSHDLKMCDELTFFKLISKLDNNPAKEYLIGHYIKLNDYCCNNMDALNEEIKKCQKGRKVKKSLLFIDHDYHELTKSDVFLLNILEQDYEIEQFYFDPYKDNDSVFEALGGKCFNVVVLFQIMPSIVQLERIIKFDTISFFPMYDADPTMMNSYWDEYKKCVIVNFSKTMHNLCINRGFTSFYFQYYPTVKEVNNWGSSKYAYFWQRQNGIDTYLFDKVIGFDNIDVLCLHDVPDPEMNIVKPSINWENKIHRSAWFESKNEMEEYLEQCSIYFAPRKYEGIGMSFLDAMAMGRCVIAPNLPTMNEYIKNGENGYLYNLENPERIELSNIKSIQEKAYLTIKNGNTFWNKEKENINKVLSLYPIIDTNRLNYQLGTKISFACDTYNASDYDMKGVYSPESWGSWINNKFEIKLVINSNNPFLHVNIKGIVYNPPKCVKVYVNGRTIFNAKCNEGYINFRFFNFRKNNEIQLAIEVLDAESPSKYGFNDKRILGYGLMEIVIDNALQIRMLLNKIKNRLKSYAKKILLKT